MSIKPYIICHTRVHHDMSIESNMTCQLHVRYAVHESLCNKGASEGWIETLSVSLQLLLECKVAEVVKLT